MTLRAVLVGMLREAERWAGSTVDLATGETTFVAEGPWGRVLGGDTLILNIT